VGEFEERQRTELAESDTRKSLDVSASKFLAMVRANGFEVRMVRVVRGVNDDPDGAKAKHMVRRFVRETLRIELRNERGKRTDLCRKTPRGS